MTDFIAEKQSPPQELMIKQYLLLTEDILFLHFASLNTWQAVSILWYQEQGKLQHSEARNTELTARVHPNSQTPSPLSEKLRAHMKATYYNKI